MHSRTVAPACPRLTLLVWIMGEMVGGTHALTPGSRSRLRLRLTPGYRNCAPARGALFRHSVPDLGSRLRLDPRLSESGPFRGFPMPSHSAVSVAGRGSDTRQDRQIGPKGPGDQGPKSQGGPENRKPVEGTRGKGEGAKCEVRSGKSQSIVRVVGYRFNDGLEGRGKVDTLSLELWAKDGENRSCVFLDSSQKASSPG